MPRKVCLVGSGNWGSAIAKIIGNTVKEQPDLFDERVNMWVYEEMIGDRKLTDIINTEHENVKYLPGHKLPENVVAVPDLKEAVTDAGVLIFCIPHQFLGRILPQIKEANLDDDLLAVSLIKGIDFDENGVVLISSIIAEALEVDCSVLMGANIANEVAEDQFCESTLGCYEERDGHILQKLFHTPNFRIEVAHDPHGVEMCGALKNVVALGAGFCDGLGYGSNTKAAIIRIGLNEMKKFGLKYLKGVSAHTFFESCGVADLITTAFGGRNRKCAEAFVKTGKSWDELEAELLNGQKLQGTTTCEEIYEVLKRSHALEEFPLFSMIHKISFEGLAPENITKF